jgi:hypothetical protein
LILNREVLKIVAIGFFWYRYLCYFYPVSRPPCYTAARGQQIENQLVMRKMIQSNAAVSFNAVVTYTDILGKRHNISCRTRNQIKQANSFLSMFKREGTTIKALAAQYNVKGGRFVNVTGLISDIVMVGFTKEAARKIVASSL